MAYTGAWTLVCLMALLGSVGLYYLTRGLETDWLKRLLRVLPPVVLIVPAPIPEFNGHYAPAFVVLLFEGIFQSEGTPMGAVTVLIAAIAISVLAVIGLTLRSRRSNPH